jgi:photosystem II stability/assembly factor-like uncharacterized protein
MTTMKPLSLLAPILSVGLFACDSGPDKPSTTTTTTTDGDTGSDTGSDTGDDTGDPPSFWVVGEEGLMLRVGADHEPSQYPLELDAELRAIACKGAEQAVVAGAGGLVLTTYDGGREWQRIEVPDAPELRAVALSGGTLGYVAGDGVVLRSEDDAHSWAALPIAAHDWTAVTTTAAGTTVLLASAAGELYRLRDTELTRVYVGAGVALRGVAITPDGSEAVAVGDGGLLLRSGDGGEQWMVEPLATARDLHAVRMASDASLVVAVGAAGAIVRLGLDDVAVNERLDAALSLRALHLDHHGHGHAVGDHGVMLETHDAGRTWAPIVHGFTADLLGLDDLHGEPHL